MAGVVDETNERNGLNHLCNERSTGAFYGIDEISVITKMCGIVVRIPSVVAPVQEVVSVGLAKSVAMEMRGDFGGYGKSVVQAIF